MQAQAGDWLVVHSHSDQGVVRRAEILSTHANGEPPFTVRWADDDHFRSGCRPQSRDPEHSCQRWTALHRQVGRRQPRIGGVPRSRRPGHPGWCGLIASRSGASQGLAVITEAALRRVHDSRRSPRCPLIERRRVQRPELADRSAETINGESSQLPGGGEAPTLSAESAIVSRVRSSGPGS